MTRPTIYLAAGPGRPEFDHLAIYLWVTAAAELSTMTINKFCDRVTLSLLGVAIAPDDKRVPYSTHRMRLEERRPTHLTGASLKRRFYAAKKKVLAEIGRAGTEGTALLERLVADMKMQLRRETGL